MIHLNLFNNPSLRSDRTSVLPASPTGQAGPRLSTETRTSNFYYLSFAGGVNDVAKFTDNEGQQVGRHLGRFLKNRPPDRLIGLRGKRCRLWRDHMTHEKDRLQSGCSTAEGPTGLSAVGQCHRSLRVEQRDVKAGLHGRLVEAGESLPGVRRLHLGGGEDPGTDECSRKGSTGRRCSGSGVHTYFSCPSSMYSLL